MITNTECNHDFLASLLVMSTKYKVQALRKDAIRELSKLYPFPPSSHPLNYNSTASTPSICAVITASNKAKAEIMVPMAYYYLAIRPLTEIFLAHDGDRLNILLARDKLKDKQRALLMNSHSERCCRCSAKCFRSWNDFIHSEAQRGLREGLNVFSWSSERCPPGVCRRFKFNLAEYIRGSQELLWSELPTYFGLRTWQELRDASNLEDWRLVSYSDV